MLEKHPQKPAAMALSLGHGALDTAQIRQRRGFLVEKVIDRGEVDGLSHPLGETLAQIPFLADHHHKLASRAERAFRLPEARREAAAGAAMTVQEFVEAPAPRSRS